MTRYEVDVREVVLRGLPHGFADDLGSLVEARLAALAAGDAGRSDAHDRRGAATVGTSAGRPPAAGPGAVADALAGRIWVAIAGANRGAER